MKHKESTREEMLRILGEMERSYRRDLENERDDLLSEFNPLDEEATKRHIQANEDNQKEIGSICDAIRTLIENMDKKPKVNRKWLRAIIIKEFYAPTIKAKLDNWILVLKEIGIEVSNE